MRGRQLGGEGCLIAAEAGDASIHAFVANSVFLNEKRRNMACRSLPNASFDGSMHQNNFLLLGIGIGTPAGSDALDHQVR